MIDAEGNQDGALSASAYLGIGFVAFLFFLATRALQHDRDTIYRLLEIESGDIRLMAEARHVLFSPLAAGFWHMWRWIGYSGSAILPGQVLVAAAGAAGIGCISYLLGRFSRDRTITVLLALAFMGSYAYWYHSTDVEYWIPLVVVIMTLTITFFRWLYETRQSRSLLWLILLTYVVVLFWSASVIFGIVIAVSLFVAPSGRSMRQRCTAFFAFGFAETILLTATYLWLGLQVHDMSSPWQVFTWVTTYSGGMPIWGSADPRRFLNSAWSLAASVLPFWDGLGLRGLMRGQLDTAKLVPQLALLTTVILAALIVLHYIRHRPCLTSEKAIRFLMLWIVSYSLFITWFDPFEPKWWVIVLIPLWLLLADLSQSWIRRTGHRARIMLAVWVVLLISANWVNSIGPRASDVGEDYRKAEYAIEQMGADDILVTPYTQEWPLYVQYFGGRRIVNLGGLALGHGKEYADRYFLDLVCRAEEGRVFMADYTQLTQDEWQFIANYGISRDMFDMYEREEAWFWQGEPVWEVTDSTRCELLP